MKQHGAKKIVTVMLVASLVGITFSSSVAMASAKSVTKSFYAKVSCRVAKAITHNAMVLTMPPVKNLGDKKVTLKTNCGNITFTAFGSKAPTTVSVFTFLVSKSFYDKTPCHRIVTNGIYILQCGDPTGTGMGNPGFQFKDENLPKMEGNNYPAGTIAMANAGPGTNGSQFFIVYADTTLPSAYTIFGQVTSGLNIVSYIASKGVLGGASDGAPKQSVFIDKVSVK